MQKLPEQIRGRFVNPHAKDTRRSLWDVLLWKIGLYNDAAKGSLAPKDFSFPLPEKKPSSDEPNAIWVNHSTFLINVFGLVFLTDPVWGQRCSPFSFLGPKRNHEPGLALDEIQKIDVVLISHNHYDHLDKQTVLFIHARHPSTLWVVPWGVKEWFTRLGILHVEELQWWQSFKIASENALITAVPAQHFSGRSLRDYNKSLWAGYIVEISSQEKKKCFYFAGDTGYNPYDFKAIGSRWQHIDLSLIPIGCYSPKVFMAPVHIDPFEAVWIHREVGSMQSIGMHWKTFTLSDEGLCRPPYDLYLALKEEGIDPLTFLAAPPGYVVNW